MEGYEPGLRIEEHVKSVLLVARAFLVQTHRVFLSLIECHIVLRTVVQS